MDAELLGLLVSNYLSRGAFNLIWTPHVGLGIFPLPHLQMKAVEWSIDARNVSTILHASSSRWAWILMVIIVSVMVYIQKYSSVRRVSLPSWQRDGGSGALTLEHWHMCFMRPMPVFCQSLLLCQVLGIFLAFESITQTLPAELIRAAVDARWVSLLNNSDNTWFSATPSELHHSPRIVCMYKRSPFLHLLCSMFSSNQRLT